MALEQREISGAERRGASLGRSRAEAGGGAQIRGKGRGSEGPRVRKRCSPRGGAGGGARAQGVSVQEGPRGGRRQAGGGAVGGPRIPERPRPRSFQEAARSAAPPAGLRQTPPGLWISRSDPPTSGGNPLSAFSSVA